MALAELVNRALHLVFAAGWVGSTFFVVAVLVPELKEATIPGETATGILEKYRWLSRISALVMLLSGGHLAATLYGGGALLGTPSGHLVLGMVLLWLVMMGLVEAGSAILAKTIRDDPERGLGQSVYPLYAAAAVGVVLLVIGALLT